MASVREPCEGSRHFIENGCKKALCILTDYPTTEPILVFAQFDLPYVLRCDKSHDGLSAILYQRQDGLMRVIGYAYLQLC